MAAFVAHRNGSAFCTAAHSATARLASGNGPTVAATLADLDTTSIPEPLRATLHMLSRLADAFGFARLSTEGFESGAQYLLKRGYN